MADPFAPHEIESVTIGGSQRMAELNSVRHPKDPAGASYSLPFSVAVALCGRQHEPEAFGAAPLNDPATAALRDRIEVVRREGSGGHSDWSAQVTIRLRNGRVLQRMQTDFPGTPTTPLDAQGIRRRFLSLVAPVTGEAAAEATLARLEQVQTLTDLADLTR